MLKNYIKIALRNIKRYKTYSFINILGLVIGMACCLFITLWILDELSFDRFHADNDQIYQVLGNGRLSSTLIPLAPALKESFPEIIYASRYERYGEPLFRRGDNAFYNDNVVVVDPDFFKIFSFRFLKGDPNTVMEDIHSIVISESIAKQFNLKLMK